MPVFPENIKIDKISLNSEQYLNELKNFFYSQRINCFKITQCIHSKNIKNLKLDHSKEFYMDPERFTNRVNFSLNIIRYYEILIHTIFYYWQELTCHIPKDKMDIDPPDDLKKYSFGILKTMFNPIIIPFILLRIVEQLVSVRDATKYDDNILKTFEAYIGKLRNYIWYDYIQRDIYPRKLEMALANYVYWNQVELQFRAPQDYKHFFDKVVKETIKDDHYQDTWSNLCAQTHINIRNSCKYMFDSFATPTTIFYGSSIKGPAARLLASFSKFYHGSKLMEYPLPEDKNHPYYLQGYIDKFKDDYAKVYFTLLKINKKYLFLPRSKETK
jgi:hypothetical protein